MCTLSHQKLGISKPGNRHLGFGLWITFRDRVKIRDMVRNRVRARLRIRMAKILHRTFWLYYAVFKYGFGWWHSIVVRTSVLAGILSLFCARLMCGRLTTLWVKHPLSVNSACHPSRVG